MERQAHATSERHKHRLTLTECLVSLVVALTLVSMHAIFLVEGNEPLVTNKNISDMFKGLILVPLVEKLAEHLGAVDEAWEDRMNFALSHVLGSTLQTALMNSSLVVIVGWGMGKNMVSLPKPPVLQISPGTCVPGLLFWIVFFGLTLVSGSQLLALPGHSAHPLHPRRRQLHPRSGVQLPRGLPVHPHLPHHRRRHLLLPQHRLGSHCSATGRCCRGRSVPGSLAQRGIVRKLGWVIGAAGRNDTLPRRNC